MDDHRGEVWRAHVFSLPLSAHWFLYVGLRYYCDVDNYYITSERLPFCEGKAAGSLLDGRWPCRSMLVSCGRLMMMSSQYL